MIFAGALLYVLGLLVMPFAQTGSEFALGAGLLIGMGLSGVTFSVVLGVVGRATAPEKRSMALGITAAAGSAGQFLMLPLEQSLIGGYGWFTALLVLAGIAALMMPLAAALAEPQRIATPGRKQSAAEATREALGHRGFVLLTLGFFVCGFQVVFIAVHLPAYLLDKGLSAQTGMIALALIGFFNIIGTYVAGYLGGRVPKKYLLSGLYFGRSIVIIVFLLAPLSPLSVYIFAASIGILWLATVPLTNGLVAQVFGVQFVSMLGGFVFFSHQIGSFLGVWAGGALFDKTGSYTIVWIIAIALGFLAALVNLPIDERPLVRAAPAPAV
jgi:predicted MFS family arabinose efflux permease